MLQTAQTMEYGMLTHCATCTCGAPARPLADDPAWQELMRRSAETDREIEAILAEADRLVAENSHAE
jgi:hypothetical protein